MSLICVSAGGRVDVGSNAFPHVVAHGGRWAALEAFARERWPQAQEVVYRWSGQVGGWGGVGWVSRWIGWVIVGRGGREDREGRGDNSRRW